MRRGGLPGSGGLTSTRRPPAPAPPPTQPKIPHQLIPANFLPRPDLGQLGLAGRPDPVGHFGSRQIRGAFRREGIVLAGLLRFVLVPDAFLNQTCRRVDCQNLLPASVALYLCKIFVVVAVVAAAAVPSGRVKGEESRGVVVVAAAAAADQIRSQALWVAVPPYSAGAAEIVGRWVEWSSIFRRAATRSGFGWGWG